MKKTRFLILTLAVAVMIMGAGYAAWTDRIETNTTVQTGELNVSLTDVGVGWGGDWGTHKGIKNDDVDTIDALEDNFTIDKDKEGQAVTFTFENVYPGVKLGTNYNMKNLGTMPAFIDDVQVDIKAYREDGSRIYNLENSKLYNAMNVRYFAEIGTYPSPGKRAHIQDGRGESGDLNPTLALADLATSLETNFVGHYVGVGEMITGGTNEGGRYHVQFYIPADSLNGDEGENERLEIKIDYDFVQHNMFEGTIQ